LAAALRQLSHGVEGVLHVPGSGVSVIGLIKTKSVLPVGVRVDAEVDARLLTPKQVGRDGNKSLRGEFVAGLADVGVNAEQLLQNDDSGSRQDLRSRDICTELPVPGLNGDSIGRFVLLR